MEFANSYASKRVIYSTGSGVSHIRKYVGIYGQGERNIGVSEQLLDVLDVDPLPQQGRGAGVSEIVEAGAFR